MGDARHKKSAPTDDEEDVTPEFRKAVVAKLVANKGLNDLAGRTKGDPGYLIANRSDLATAIGTDKTQINNIIGPARETSKVDLVDRSAFVGKIRAVLGLPRQTWLAVPADRADLVRLIAALSPGDFDELETAVRQLAAAGKRAR